MDIRVLKNFLAVAEEGNMTAAANSLHISQSSLSRQMSDLEEELQTKLLVRTNRSTSLSTEGLRFREYAYRIVQLADETLDLYQNKEQNLSGTVRICLSGSPASRHIVRAVSSLMRKHPDVRIELISADPENAVKCLDSGTADFALLTEPYPKDPYHTVSLCTDEPLGILMRSDDPLAENDSISHTQLKQMKLFVFHRFIDPRFTKKLNVSRRELHTIGTYTMVHDAVPLVTEGTAYLLCTGPDTDYKDTVFRPLSPSVSYETVLAYRKHHVLSPQAEAFLIALQTILSERT